MKTTYEPEVDTHDELVARGWNLYIPKGVRQKSSTITFTL